MRALFLICILSFTVACNDVESRNQVNITITSGDRPFKRAMIMAGLNINTGAFIGAYSALVDAGQAPDLIIATCGGSIAASIVNTYEDPRLAHDFVASEEFYEMISGAMQVRSNKLTTVAPDFLSFFRKGFSGTIYNFFDLGLVDLPLDVESSKLRQEFRTDGPRIIVVASRILFDSSRVGTSVQDGEKLFRETYFTDPVTAEILRKIKIESPIGGYVESETGVVSDVPITQAMIASSSDMGVFPAARIGSDFYLAGSVNLHPIELAHRLADDLWVDASREWDAIETPALENTFGFDANARERLVARQGFIHHWIDFSDFGDVEYKVPSIQFDVLNRAVWAGIQLENAQSYTEKMRRLYEYGRMRAEEALNAPVHSRAHVRNDIAKE